MSVFWHMYAVGTTITDSPPPRNRGGNWPKNETALVIEKVINLREMRYELVQEPRQHFHFSRDFDIGAELSLN